MEIEVKTAYEQNGKSVSVKVTEQMDTRNEEKIRMMKNVIMDFYPKGLSAPIQVQSLPMVSGNDPDSSPENPKMISKKQVIYLRDLLKQNKITETQFCNQNHVTSLNQLSNDDARALIEKLK